MADQHYLEQYLSDKHVAQRYDCHRITPWRWVREGNFPPPVKLGGLTRWKLSDLERWEAQHDKGAA